jgi:hypothetical protein
MPGGMCPISPTGLSWHARTGAAVCPSLSPGRTNAGRIQTHTNIYSTILCHPSPVGDREVVRWFAPHRPDRREAARCPGDRDGGVPRARRHVWQGGGPPKSNLANRSRRLDRPVLWYDASTAVVKRALVDPGVSSPWQHLAGRRSAGPIVVYSRRPAPGVRSCTHRTRTTGRKGGAPASMIAHALHGASCAGWPRALPVLLPADHYHRRRDEHE